MLIFLSKDVQKKIEEHESIIEKQLKLIEMLGKKCEELEKKIDNLPKSVIDYGDRLAEVEIKQAKLYSALLEYTPTGKQKLTKLGKTFGGKSQHLL